MVLTFLDWIKARENTARTAMDAEYPSAYFASQYPPLAVTPQSANAARAYTHQYKYLLNNLRKKKHKKKRHD